MTDKTDNADANDNQLASQILSKLADDYLKEKKRKRLWSTFFKLTFLTLLILILWFYWRSDKSTTEPNQQHVALIDIQGVIFENSINSNADDIAKSLRSAFSDKKVKAIILRINSPGGSAVQADYVFNEIIRLRQENPDMPVYAVCTDMCASAAYYIAVASDAIYANPASLVGSIGVLYNGFGFTGAMEKLGIERRLFTSNQHKGFMDPFSPANAAEEQHLQTLINGVFTQFKQSVITGRGDRLGDNDTIFSGLFWNGMDAKKLGLIDGFGSTGSVARDILGIDIIVDYTVKPNYFERLARELGVSASSHFAQQIGLQSQGLR
jgi:protease IV